MKREEDWLREACAQLAREETEQLERSLTGAELRRAEEAYRRHRPQALSLIRRNTRGHRPARLWLRAAAVVAALGGAAYLALRQPPPDTVPQALLSAVTAAPYYSPAPSAGTEWAMISTITPYHSPTPTLSPTNTPVLKNSIALSPTPTPIPAEPAPPEGWTGSHFPMGMLNGDAPFGLYQGEGWQQVTWGNWGFTEYADDRVLAVPEGAEISYVQWEDLAALRAEADGRVTLIWVQDGHSMRLTAEGGDALEMAKTVKKIFGE